jgi:hypothetical protein
LLDLKKFDLEKCLEKSIKSNSCEKGDELNKVMLITDSNEPILKVLIDGELSRVENEDLDKPDKTSVEK